ncbi:MAG: hypothetical protein IJ583_07265 [Firmicutes bacterium]|nr:hypothetical protein [Bacillota bacterium]
MLKPYTVSLFGHRIIADTHHASSELEKIISHLILTKEYVEFLIGRNGDFDILAASIIRRCIKRYDRANTSLTLILPYPTAEFARNEEYYLSYYDSVEIFSSSRKTHFKAAFSLRNKYMADRSDLIICCIDHSGGGAYNAVKYALSLNKQFYNTASTPPPELSDPQNIYRFP